MQVKGHCHCGKISYEAEIDPATATICHCTDCQMLTGSVYRATVRAAAGTFVLHGAPKIYVKTADSGAKRAHAFCSNCGSPVYASAVEKPTTYSLRIGALDRRHELRPVRQQWCVSGLAWATDIGGIDQIERQ